jgi:xanthosine utilization system XapX-like protein
VKITEIIAIGAAIVSGVFLALIQIRRIISGELSPFGLQSIKEAAKIEIDRIDKRFLLVSGISIIVCIVFAFISYE